jgi:2'-5' RNA ligase
LDEYKEAVAEAVEAVPPIDIRFHGITLTPGAILAQGFPSDMTLEELREGLRRALAARGLAGALNQRYRLATAHMTLVRFATPLRNREQFVELLKGFRDAELGTTRVTHLDLVLGDWYQSRANEQHLAAYALT